VTPIIPCDRRDAIGRILKFSNVSNGLPVAGKAMGGALVLDGRDEMGYYPARPRGKIKE
jgi:hypothetical protein